MLQGWFEKWERRNDQSMPRFGDKALACKKFRSAIIQRDFL